MADEEDDVQHPDDCMCDNCRFYRKLREETDKLLDEAGLERSDEIEKTAKQVANLMD